MKCLSLLLIVSVVSAGDTYYTAYVDSGSATGFVVKPGKDTKNGACFGFFTDEINATGWARLSLTSNAALLDITQVAACGHLEGYFTHERIWQNKINSWAGDFEDYGGHPPQKLFDWMVQHRMWLDAQNTSNPVIAQVKLMNAQLRAMADAIALYGSQQRPVSFEDLCMMNAGGDSGDILESLGLTKHVPYSQMTAVELWEDLARRGHCSAIVKATPDLTDLYMSHCTWGHYPTMLRVSKAYHFALHNVASRGMLFVGYFGLIVSDDDLYSLEDTRLAVTETTNDVINDELFKLITPKSLLYWERVIATNRLATDGRSWTDLFSTEQSGTYSNQWMVVDFKRFVPGKQIQPGTLWISESCPGHTITKDVSQYLRVSHWPSFNRPFFDEMFDLMGYTVATQKYGNVFSYDACPRANIFRRDAARIVSVDTLKSFITSNSWKTDPFSNSFPGNTVSARFDLKGGPSTGSPWDNWWKLGPHGGTDGKIIAASTTTATSHEIIAISGPPVNDQCPPFEWSGQWANVSHLGHPIKFDFPWVRLTNA